MSRFDYVKYDEISTHIQSEFKKKFEELEVMVNELSDEKPKFFALMKLEEGYMWVGKSIRDTQILNRPTEELEEENVN